MHRIHFHYHSIAFCNVVSLHWNACIHQYTWYHGSYKYSSLSCLSYTKSQLNPLSLWSMVPLWSRDSYLPSITFVSDLVKCFYPVCLWSSCCLILEKSRLSKLRLLPSCEPTELVARGAEKCYSHRVSANSKSFFEWKLELMFDSKRIKPNNYFIADHYSVLMHNFLMLYIIWICVLSRWRLTLFDAG